MFKFLFFEVFNSVCIFSLSGVGLFFLMFLTSLIHIFLVFVLSLRSLCKCDAISYVLILFRFGSVVLVLAREAFSVLFFFPVFVVAFMLYVTCGGISLPSFYVFFEGRLLQT